MATRRDFEAIAAQIRNSAQTLEEKRRQAEAMADYLATTNERFDRRRFVEAATRA
jgi:hypothetical protein